MKNDVLQGLIGELKKLSIQENVDLWKRVATDLEMPSRQRRVVNLSRLARYSKENDAVIVPGKVLGSGDINHKLIVVAHSFSGKAAKKIQSLNGSAYTISDYIKKNPQGKGLRILG